MHKQNFFFHYVLSVVSCLKKKSATCFYLVFSIIIDGIYNPQLCFDCARWECFDCQDLDTIVAIAHRHT